MFSRLEVAGMSGKLIELGIALWRGRIEWNRGVVVCGGVHV